MLRTGWLQILEQASLSKISLDLNFLKKPEFLANYFKVVYFCRKITYVSSILSQISLYTFLIFKKKSLLNFYLWYISNAELKSWIMFGHMATKLYTLELQYAHQLLDLIAVSWHWLYFVGWTYKGKRLALLEINLDKDRSAYL